MSIVDTERKCEKAQWPNEPNSSQAQGREGEGVSIASSGVAVQTTRGVTLLTQQWHPGGSGGPQCRDRSLTVASLIPQSEIHNPQFSIRTRSPPGRR